MSNAAKTTLKPETYYYILDDSCLEIPIAKRLHAAGDRVTVFNKLQDSIVVPEMSGDPSNPEPLDDACVASADMVVVSTRSDQRNGEL